MDSRTQTPVADRKISPRFSVALDAARAAAAFYVVLHHVGQARGWTEGGLASGGVLLRFGQEAVLIFFLLSGFVIFLNERRRADDVSGYFQRRFRRIYPTLIAAMAVSALVALDNGDFLARFSWWELLGTLLSLQDVAALKPGVIVAPFLDNEPLWSLSYEVAFYLVFPLVIRFWLRRPALTNHAVGVVCCLCYAAFILAPNHFTLVGAYFLVWWCGAMAADAYQRGGRSFFAMRPILLWLVALCCVACLAFLVTPFDGVGHYPFLPLRHFAVALLMILVLFGPVGSALCAGVTWLGRVPVAVASISYGVYVLHFPLMVQWRGAATLPGLAVGFGLLILTSYVFDRVLSRFLTDRAAAKRRRAAAPATASPPAGPDASCS